MSEKKLLAIVTNIAEFTKAGYRTGLWLGELTHFMDVVEEAGYTVDIASPSGGWVPIDPESLLLDEAEALLGMKGSVYERYADRTFMCRLGTTWNVREINPESYAAIYLAGGHGAMCDFKHRGVPELVEDFFEDDKIVAAVCHGAAGLLYAQDGHGKHLLAGRQVTGFSWKEEELAKRDEAVSYNLEEWLEKCGGKYEKASLPFAAHVVVDGKLITGQNPRSAKGVAEAVVKCLRES